MLCAKCNCGTASIITKKKYYDIMLRTAKSILRPFGYDRDMLDDVVLGREQMKVEYFVRLSSINIDDNNQLSSTIVEQYKYC
jgi:hypothetical protein